jgi:tetratricopeptide (TPR) repeat protein
MSPTNQRQVVTLSCAVAIIFTVASLLPAQGEDFGELMSRVRDSMQQGKYADALPMVQRAVEVSENFPSSDPRHWQALMNLAYVFDSLGEDAKALEIYIDLRAGRWGPPPAPQWEVLMLQSLGRMHLLLNRFTDAEELYVRALKIEEGYLPPANPARANGLIGMAGFYLSQGRHTDAVGYAEVAVELTGQLPDDAPLRLRALNVLGGVYNGLRQFDKSLPLYEGLLARMEARYGSDNPQIITYLDNVAAVHLMKGDLPEAGAFFRRVLTLAERVGGPDSPELSITSIISR